MCFSLLRSSFVQGMSIGLEIGYMEQLARDALENDAHIHEKSRNNLLLLLRKIENLPNEVLFCVFLLTPSDLMDYLKEFHGY